jgi:hypothetical protein
MSPDIPLPVGGAVGGAVSAEAAGFAQRPHVSLVSLDAPVAGGVRGREARVGDDDFVSKFLTVACAPVAGGEQLIEALLIALDAALGKFAVCDQN